MGQITEGMPGGLQLSDEDFGLESSDEDSEVGDVLDMDERERLEHLEDIQAEQRS